MSNYRYLAAIPPRPGKDYDLPSILARRIAAALGREDLTPRFAFSGQKDSIKSISFDEKWAAWEAAGLTFSPSFQGSPSLILIDDKYQSGMTMQFVASRLYAAGVGKVYGLCAVKTLRDTDNQ